MYKKCPNTLMTAGYRQGRVCCGTKWFPRGSLKTANVFGIVYKIWRETKRIKKCRPPIFFQKASQCSPGLYPGCVLTVAESLKARLRKGPRRPTLRKMHLPANGAKDDDGCSLFFFTFVPLPNKFTHTCCLELISRMHP